MTPGASRRVSKGPQGRPAIVLPETSSLSRCPVVLRWVGRGPPPPSLMHRHGAVTLPAIAPTQALRVHRHAAGVNPPTRHRGEGRIGRPVEISNAANRAGGVEEPHLRGIGASCAGARAWMFSPSTRRRATTPMCPFATTPSRPVPLSPPSGVEVRTPACVTMDGQMEKHDARMHTNVHCDITHPRRRRRWTVAPASLLRKPGATGMAEGEMYIFARAHPPSHRRGAAASPAVNVRSAR